MACQGLMKGFLFILNAILFMGGLATLGLAIWIKVDKKYLLDLTEDVSGADLTDTDVSSLLENAVDVLIAVGAVIFVLGFLGCCGTIGNKTVAGKVFLKAYSAIIFILLTLEMAGVAVALLFFDKMERKLEEYLDVSLHDRYNGGFTSSTDESTIRYSSGGDPITLAWDTAQVQFSCCGRANGTDYIAQPLVWDANRAMVRGGVEVNMTVPPTCCEIKGGTNALLKDLKRVSTAEFSLSVKDCPFLPANSSVPGCYEEVKRVIKSNASLFIATGCTLVAVEAFCIVFSCCLAKRDLDEVSVLNDED